MKIKTRKYASAFVGACCFTLAAPVAAQDPISPPRALVIADEAAVVEAQQRAEPFTMSVRILGQNRELWAGDLAMSASNRAQVRIDVQDSDIGCPVENDRFADRRNAVEFQVRRGYGRNSARYTVETNWTRPTASCAEQGSLATGFEVQVELDKGETRVIEGDGGLRVELTRR